jgi:hypothetical protein
VLLTLPTDNHLQKNIAKKTADKCNDTNMATLITTDQQIMTGLQTTDTEEDSFAVIMKADHGMVMRNTCHNPPYSMVQHR